MRKNLYRACTNIEEGYSQIKYEIIKKNEKRKKDIARFFVYTAEKLSYTFIANAKSYDKHC